MLHMILNEPQTDAYDKIAQELRRGVLILAVLSQLQEETHGYALISTLAEHGLTIDQGTLYPLLRRLETQGLLQSQWNMAGSRPRRYYVITPAGEAILNALKQDWHTLAAVMNRLFTQPEDTHNGTD
jgi:PadR family transcriptional regulator, regulatory protein PadR